MPPILTPGVEGVSETEAQELRELLYSCLATCKNNRVCFLVVARVLVELGLYIGFPAKTAVEMMMVYADDMRHSLETMRADLRLRL
jgi:hypothetical protein